MQLPEPGACQWLGPAQVWGKVGFITQKFCPYSRSALSCVATLPCWR